MWNILQPKNQSFWLMSFSVIFIIVIIEISWRSLLGRLVPQLIQYPHFSGLVWWVWYLGAFTFLQPYLMYVKGKCCQCWCIYLCFYALQSIYTFTNFFMQLLFVMNSTIALWVMMYLGISPDHRHLIVTICLWSWLQPIGYNLNWPIVIMFLEK
mgnify:CR=1 FL=1